MRLGIPFTVALKVTGQATERQLDTLERVVDYRNAIGHGDEAKIVAFEARGRDQGHQKSSSNTAKRSTALPVTMDDVVAQQLASLLSIPKPW